MKLSSKNLAAAALLHVLLLALLFGGVQCRDKLVQPTPIAAVLIDASSLPKPGKRPPAKPAAEPKPLPAPEPEPLPPEPEPQPEPLPEPEPKPELPPKPAPKPEPAPDPKVEVLAQQAAEAEIRARQKAQQEAERKATRERDKALADEELINQARREERERKLQQAIEEAALREAALQEQLAVEAAQRERGNAQQRAAALGAWASAIQRVIKSNWQRPPSSLEDFTCAIEITISPSGDVLSARVTRSCGSSPLDDSVVRAVYKSDPLPTPGDPSVFQRVITINFKP